MSSLWDSATEGLALVYEYVFLSVLFEQACPQSTFEGRKLDAKITPTRRVGFVISRIDLKL